MGTGRRINARLVLLPLLFTWSASAAETDWVTGQQFTRALNRPIGVTWSENPLRQALASLSRAERVAIFLDRRVDPDQRIAWNSSGQSVETTLRLLAEKLDCGICRVGSLIYFGPPDTAERLAALVQLRTEQLADTPLRDLTRKRSWQWPILSAPRSLLTEWADERGVTLTNLADIPHDLWPAVSLPPLSGVEQLSLVLAGFHLTFEFVDGRTLKLVPIPQRLVLTRSYTRDWTPALLAQIRTALPDAQVRRQGPQLTVTADIETHQRLAELLAKGHTRVTRRRPGKTVYTLKVENVPVGAVLKSVAQRSGLQLRVAAEAEAKLQTLVSFDLKDVPLETLLKTALQPGGLTFQLEDETLRIE